MLLFLLSYLLCFNFINTSRKFRGGENRKTEIQKKGVGGGRISLFVLFYYNLQRWSKGVGVLGAPVVPRLTCLASRPLHLLAATQDPTSQLPSSSGIGSPRRETSCFQPNGRLQQNERSHSWCVIHLCYHFHFHLSLKRWFSPL